MLNWLFIALEVIFKKASQFIRDGIFWDYAENVEGLEIE